MLVLSLKGCGRGGDREKKAGVRELGGPRAHLSPCGPTSREAASSGQFHLTCLFTILLVPKLNFQSRSCLQLTGILSTLHIWSGGACFAAKCLSRPEFLGANTWLVLSKSLATRRKCLLIKYRDRGSLDRRCALSGPLSHRRTPGSCGYVRGWWVEKRLKHKEKQAIL